MDVLEECIKIVQKECKPAEPGTGKSTGA